MAEGPAFQKLQFEFAGHIRDPQNVAPPPGIEDRRMAIYRELFYNNVESLLATSFPVLRKISDDKRWHALIRDYFATHRASTPYFLEIGQEFLRYLQDERGSQPQDFPFLLELAHYEWVELAVSVLEVGAAPAELQPDGDLLDGIPLANPAAWSLAYNFDVHRIGVTYQPTAPPAAPTCLVVYRKSDFDMGFLEINPVTARLIELIKRDEHVTGRALLTQIAHELQHPDPAAVIDGGAQTLQDLREHSIILGALPAPDATGET